MDSGDSAVLSHGLFDKELVPLQPDQFWREESGVVCFDINSSGRKPDDWIVHFYDKEYWFGGHHYVTDIILTKLVPTEKKYTVAVLRDSVLPDGASRTDIDSEADHRGFVKPTVEIACLLRETLSNANIIRMGFHALIVMHEPVKLRSQYESLCGTPVLLMLYPIEGRRAIGTHSCGAPVMHKKNRGFVYLQKM